MALPPEAYEKSALRALSHSSLYLNNSFSRSLHKADAFIYRPTHYLWPLYDAPDTITFKQYLCNQTVTVLQQAFLP